MTRGVIVNGKLISRDMTYRYYLLSRHGGDCYRARIPSYRQANLPSSPRRLARLRWRGEPQP